MAKIKNIYGSELEKCNSNSNHQLNDSSINGYCNESKNGYHNICISMNPYISNNFSEITGQGSWSKTKEGKNHCICQGAWANYVAKLKENKENKENKKLQLPLPLGILNCEAIPETVLKSSSIAI